MFARLYHALLVASFIFSISISTSHAAKIYHWVDDNGQAHYSETPPRDIVSKKLNIRPAGTGSKGSEGSSESSDEHKATTKNKPEKEEQKEEAANDYSPEEKAQYCQQSNDLMQQMNGSTQRRFKQPDGSYRKLTESEIADYRSQAQAGIDNYCKK
tara:strand:- start:2274 stop:2741 length:468 start_codon:yes stop_codon:yes gene_type:complete